MCPKLGAASWPPTCRKRDCQRDDATTRAVRCVLYVFSYAKTAPTHCLEITIFQIPVRVGPAKLTESSKPLPKPTPTSGRQRVGTSGERLIGDGETCCCCCCIRACPSHLGVCDDVWRLPTIIPFHAMFMTDSTNPVHTRRVFCRNGMMSNNRRVGVSCDQYEDVKKLSQITWGSTIRPNPNPNRNPIPKPTDQTLG